jgi:hypothetical protein
MDPQFRRVIAQAQQRRIRSHGEKIGFSLGVLENFANG